MTEKDKKIIYDAELNDIPIFVLTAKDANATPTMVEYLKFCCMCEQEHQEGISDRVREFDKWQRDNYKLVKLPD